MKLTCKLLISLIIGSIIIFLTPFVCWNNSLHLDACAKSDAFSVCDVNDKYTSIFLKGYIKHLTNAINKNEVVINEKLEYFSKQYSNISYSAFFILAGNTVPLQKEEKRSDLFYYILGIIILIISALILKQRYKQYQKERDKIKR